MKKTITTLFLGFLFFNLNAQFAPEGATWHYGEAFAFSGDKNFMKFVAEGDTIINGVTCQKIQKYGKVACLGRASQEFTFEENEVVYYSNPYNDDFEILYDFTAEPNDNWLVYSYEFDGSENEVTVTVDSTDTVLINGVVLKRMYVNYEHDFLESPGNSAILIERIGDIYYMFNFHNQAYLVCDGNFSTGLRCYEDLNIGLYETGIETSCEYTYAWTSVTEIEKNERIVIFPNPATDLITIKSEFAVAPENYVLRDFTGKLLQKGVLKK